MLHNDPNVKLDMKLLQKFGINEIGKRKWNKMNPNNHLISIGQKLVLFVGKNIDQSSNMSARIVYTVKSGDQLGYIAEKYNTSAKKIREWNQMKPGSSAIYPGQKLVLFTE